MTQLQGAQQERQEQKRGVIFALAAFGLWALNPIFFKALAGVNPFEVIAHRAFWSVPVALAIIVATGRLKDVMRVYRTPHLLFKLLITGLLISVNWTVFVWMISVGMTLEASLAYFINPLLNVVFGFFLLGERFSKPQTIAVGIAVTGVLVQTIGSGVFPWASIFLAATFATYGFMRKTVEVGPVQGFMVETSLLLPFSIGLALWFGLTGQASFAATTSDTLLLIAAGPVTAAPLLFYAAGVKRLRYSTIGIMQFLAPSVMFLIAVFLFGEHLDIWKMISFVLIWVALIVYTFDAVRNDRARTKALLKSQQV